MTYGGRDLAYLMPELETSFWLRLLVDSYYNPCPDSEKPRHSRQKDMALLMHTHPSHDFRSEFNLNQLLAPSRADMLVWYDRDYYLSGAIDAIATSKEGVAKVLFWRRNSQRLKHNKRYHVGTRDTYLDRLSRQGLNCVYADFDMESTAFNGDHEEIAAKLMR